MFVLWVNILCIALEPLAVWTVRHRVKTDIARRDTLGIEP